MDNLAHGEPYSKLKESYIIFLCLEDPFHNNLPVYFFENLCRQDTGIKLDDKAYKVFFNASEYDKMEDGEEKAFFKFLSGLPAESELAKSIEEKVSLAKKNMVWRKMYMTWEQTIQEEKELSFEQGRTEANLDTARKMLSEHCNIDLIVRVTGLSQEEIQTLAGQLK